MRTIYLLLFLLICHGLVLGQSTGSIKGSVKTSDGNPGEFVNVSIVGTSKGTAASHDGAYEIKNVAPGTCTLIASFIGLESKKQEVTVVSGQITHVDFVLSESALQLEEVIVSGRAQLNKKESYSAKIPLKKLENPQVYNSVSSEILRQQAVTSYDDAFRNVPGVFRTWGQLSRTWDKDLKAGEQ